MTHTNTVSVTGLLPGVSLTLSGMMDGWKFQAWSRHDGQLIRVSPWWSDQVRSFADVADAAAYFRERYGRDIDSERAAQAQRDAARGLRDPWLS